MAKSQKFAQVKSDWWKSMFESIGGELMFKSRLSAAAGEVTRVLRATRTKRGALILDVPCGNGRHAFEFARRGYRVTGLDYTASYIDEARKESRYLGLQKLIEFVRGDMRKLRPHFSPETFDLVVNLWNSFGYFERRSDDLVFLKEVYRVLKPGGALVVNTLNEGGVRARLLHGQSQATEFEENAFIIDEARYDPRERKLYAKWTVVDARKPRCRIVRTAFRQNVYSHAELKALMRKAGFRVEKVWGPLGGGRLNPAKSWHQTIVALKPRTGR